MHQNAVREHARLVAVAVVVLSAREDARVKGQFRESIGQKVGREVQKPQPVQLLADAITRPDDAVDEVKIPLFVQRLAPVVERADELLAVCGKQLIGRDAAHRAHFSVDGGAHAVGPDDDLIGLGKQLLAKRPVALAAGNDLHAPVPAIAGQPARAHPLCEPHDGVVLFLPHDLL